MSSKTETEPVVLRKARVETASGVLADLIVGHHMDSRGYSWDRMVFSNGEFIDIPDESRYGVSFDLVAGKSYSARWATLPSGRRGLQVYEGLGFGATTESDTAPVEY